MATKEQGKKKYVASVTSPLAIDKMTSKLSTYLGITVSETAAPIVNYKKFAGKADDYFDKLYANQKIAYGG